MFIKLKITEMVPELKPHEFNRLKDYFMFFFLKQRHNS